MPRFRLPSFFPRARKLWLGAAVLFAVVLGLLLFRIDLHFDIGAILTGLALVLAAWTVFYAVRHWVKPKHTVAVGYNVKLEQPLVPVVGRYAFRLEVFYEVEEKGERARVDQGTIELRFRKSDHPEMLTWCCAQIGEHLGKHATFASESYPGARVVLPPAPSPAWIGHKVAIGANSG